MLGALCPDFEQILPDSRMQAKKFLFFFFHSFLTATLNPNIMMMNFCLKDVEGLYIGYPLYKMASFCSDTFVSKSVGAI